jgi:alanine dehydrogenase
MGTIVLSPTEVRELLKMPDCIQLMEQALKTLGRGEAVNPLRRGMVLPEGKGLLGMMPGYLGSPEAMGLKIVSVFPGNHGTDFDSHQGIVMLFEMEHGTPLAIVDASEVTAIRTAAVSGVATRILSRPDASVLAIIGSGVQARTHLEAMISVRTITEVRVFSPNEHNRNEFAKREAARYNVTIQAVGSVAEAVHGADIVCTTTSAREPILLGEWLSPGMHINAVGSSVKFTRELDTSAVVRSRLFVDRRESTANEAGDYLFPLQEGAITEKHIIAEIGELLLGEMTGREGRDEITLFKSLGLAIQDLAAAHYLNDAGRAARVGTIVNLGGTR